MPPLSLEALRGLTGRLATLGLLHGVWIALLAASATAITLRAVPPRRRRLRYHLLLFALALVAIGAPSAALLQRTCAGPRASRPTPDTTSTFVVSLGHPHADAPEAPTGVPLPAPTRAPGRSPMPLAATAVVALESLQPVVLAGWLLVAAPLALTLAIGMLATAVRRRESTAAPASIQSRSDRLAGRLGLRQMPRVLIHPRLDEPCLCGLFRPAVLLPGRWLAWVEAGQDAGRLDAILAHELAHARRLDLPVNLAQRLVEVAFFFHPAVHWLSRSLRRQRELCADALAVSLTGDPLALAEALESVARLRPPCRRALRLDASLGGDHFSLLTRVQEILGMTPTRPRPRLWPLAALPAAALVALLSTSLGLAQDPPKPAVPQLAPSALASPAGDIDPERMIPREYRSFDAHVENPSEFDPNRQISYETRFVDVRADLWRNFLEERLRRAGDAGDPAWIIDKDDMRRLFTEIQGDVRSNLLQAPKVTAFEAAHAKIINSNKREYVSRLEPIRTAKALAFRPTIEAIDIGSTVELSGSILPGETRLTADIKDTSLVAMHTLKRHEEHAGMAINAEYQVPTTKERHHRSTSRIPQGSTLVVSLGLYDQTDELTGAARVASAFIESFGGGRIEPRRDTRERLVLITPRPILLEDEEERLGIPAPTAARGGGR